MRLKATLARFEVVLIFERRVQTAVLTLVVDAEDLTSTMIRHLGIDRRERRSLGRGRGRQQKELLSVVKMMGGRGGGRWEFRGSLADVGCFLVPEYRSSRFVGVLIVRQVQVEPAFAVVEPLIPQKGLE